MVASKGARSAESERESGTLRERRRHALEQGEMGRNGEPVYPKQKGEGQNLKGERRRREDRREEKRTETLHSDSGLVGWLAPINGPINIGDPDGSPNIPARRERSSRGRLPFFHSLRLR